jgi:sarcosine oxidase
VPLLQRAYALWDELSAESGAELLLRCGLLLAGAPAGAVIAGARRAAAEHGPELIEEVPRAALAGRFPGFRLAEGMEALLEPEGGLLRVEACVRAHAAQALGRGAVLHEGEAVREIHATPGGVTVETDRGRYEAGGVVLCGGAYSGPLLRSLALPLPPLQLRRKLMLWYDVQEPAYRLDHGCPVFAFDTDEGFFYGFPILDAAGLKVAEHSGGEEVRDPDALDRGLRPEDEAPVRRFLSRHLPAAALAPRKHHAACMYTMTPDEHFLIDRHPAHDNVVFAAGFSGHGFKFASVVGEALADLADAGRTALPVEFLGAARFAEAR